MKNKVNVDTLYNKKGITDILTNITCSNENDNCNVLKPYSKLDLYSVNPVSNKIYTLSERNDFITNYDNKCKNSNINSKKKLCCSRDINNINYLNSSNELLRKSFQDMRKVYPFVKNTNQNDKINSIEVCRDNDTLCVEKGYSVPNNFQLCKLLKNDYLNVNEKYQTIDNLNSDCLKYNCNDELSLKNNSNYLEDILIYNAIKLDNSTELKNNLNGNPRLLDNALIYPNSNPIIHETIINNSIKCFRLLLGYNANLNVIDKYQNNPLHMSCLLGREIMTYMLLKQGMSLTTTNKYGDTPLHCAAKSGNSKLIHILLNENSNVNVLNNNNESPLFSSVKSPKKKLEVVKLLIQNGSEINLRNKDNLSLINILEQDKSKESKLIITYLKRKYYDSSKNNKNYMKMIESNPEISPFELSDIDKSINSENVEVEVEYDEKSEQPKYFVNKEFPKKYFREDFVNYQQNNTIKLILILIFIVLVICKILIK